MSVFIHVWRGLLRGEETPIRTYDFQQRSGPKVQSTMAHDSECDM